MACRLVQAHRFARTRLSTGWLGERGVVGNDLLFLRVGVHHLWLLTVVMMHMMTPVMVRRVWVLKRIFARLPKRSHKVDIDFAAHAKEEEGEGKVGGEGQGGDLQRLHPGHKQPQHFGFVEL